MRQELSGILISSGLVLLAVTLIQLGSATSHGLFPVYGPLGVLFLRSLFAGLVLAVIQRRNLADALRKDPLGILIFGVCMAVENGTFLIAIERIPLGVTVTIEFLGPILTALAGSRSGIEFVWILLAAAGIAVLAPDIGSGLDPVGVILASISGAGWAGFILCSKRLGKTVGKHGALPLAILFCCLTLLPLSIWHVAEATVANPAAFVTVMFIGLFASALPLSLEYRALQTLKAQNYGVLVAAEPVVAMLIGLVFLGDRLSPTAWLAMGIITASSIGMTLTAPKKAPPIHD